MDEESGSIVLNGIVAPQRCCCGRAVGWLAVGRKRKLYGRCRRLQKEETGGWSDGNIWMDGGVDGKMVKKRTRKWKNGSMDG